MSVKTIEINSLEITKGALQGLLTQGDEIILTDDGQPVARLTPIENTGQSTGQRVPDLFPGIWISDDFNDPLPDSFWLGESE